MRTYRNVFLNFNFFIGIGTFVCTYFFIHIWVYTGQANAKRIRERYLQAVLRQDIAFFDKVGAGEIATRIQTDTRASFIYVLTCTYLNNSQILSSKVSQKKWLSSFPSSPGSSLVLS